MSNYRLDFKFQFPLSLLVFCMLILDSPRRVTRAQGVPSFLPTHTMIQENKDGSLKIGHVRLDPTGKNIAFPAEINMRKGQLEYALTGPLGKLHESLLKTKTTPGKHTSCHVAFGNRSQTSSH